MAKIRKTVTREVIVVHSGDIPPGVCPLCGSVIHGKNDPSDTVTVDATEVDQAESASDPE